MAAASPRGSPAGTLGRACVVSLATIVLAWAAPTSRTEWGFPAADASGRAPSGQTGRHERSDAVPSANASGSITIEAAGRKRTINVPRAGITTTGSRDWQVSRRISFRAVRPLWERADGTTLADNPQYRGRDFTPDGKLIGRGGTLPSRRSSRYGSRKRSPASAYRWSWRTDPILMMHVSIMPAPASTATLQMYESQAIA